MASYRRKVGGRREKFLGWADDENSPITRKATIAFAEAQQRAEKWFQTAEVLADRVDGFPMGRFNVLCACPVSSTYTVLSAMADYIEYRKNFRSPTNHIPIVYMANAYIIPLIGNVAVDDLTIAQARSVALEVEATVAKRGSTNPRTRIDPNTLSSEVRRGRRVTANNTLSVLRSALKAAYLAGKTSNDAVWMHSSGFRTVQKSRVAYFTWEQARLIVQSARPDLRALVLAALYTGARLSEILEIRGRDVLLQRKAVYITPQKTYRGRTIALPEEGYKFFRSLCDDNDKDRRLFPRYDGGLFTTYYVASHFRRLMSSLGLPQLYVFHTLRHTYASLLMQAGTPPVVVARQLGHLNMQTVIKHYTHVCDDFYDVELRARYQPNFLTMDC